ncbi:site-specific integrase [Acinetobacter sp. CUI P1]|nr:site-specific integrase [Acinetobacter sp. CUI P1]
MKKLIKTHPMVKFFINFMRRQGTKQQSIDNNYVSKLVVFFSWLTRVYPIFKNSNLGNLVIAFVTTDHIRDYKTYLVRQVRDGNMTAIGAKRSLQYVKTFFRILYQKKRIPNDIGEFVTNIKADDYKYRSIPNEELLQQFFHAVDQYAVDPHMERLAYLLMLNVGLRGSEIAYLQWRDVNLSTKTIAVNDTKGENCIIPLPNIVVNYFIFFLEHQGSQEGSDRVFSQWKPSTLRTHLYQMFKIYCIVIGFKAEGGAHLFRHAYITRLANARCKPGDLLYLSRHNSPQSLPMYLHSSKEELTSEINKISLF